MPLISVILGVGTTRLQIFLYLESRGDGDEEDQGLVRGPKLVWVVIRAAVEDMKTGSATKHLASQPIFITLRILSIFSAGRAISSICMD